MSRIVILRQITEKFDANGTQAEELLAHGRWLVHGRPDLGETLRRLAPVIRKTCLREQQIELIAMLRAVAEADGRIDPTVAADLKWLTQSLKPA